MIAWIKCLKYECFSTLLCFTDADKTWTIIIKRSFISTLSHPLSLFASISLLTLISFKIPSSPGCGLTVTDLPPTVFGSLNLNWPSNPGRDSHTCSHSAYMLVTLCWIWLILTSKRQQRGGERRTKTDESSCRHERAEERQERKKERKKKQERQTERHW